MIKRHFSAFTTALGILVGAASIALAQAPVQQAPTRLDAATGVCSTAPAINATQAVGTCTITPPSGQYVYFTYLQVANCLDGTASVSGIQLAFTSTNLNGWTAQTSTLSAATISTNAGTVLCDRVGGARATPLKSAQAGTAVTIVPPAQQAHSSYPIIAEYYFAP